MTKKTTVGLMVAFLFLFATISGMMLSDRVTPSAKGATIDATWTEDSDEILVWLNASEDLGLIAPNWLIKNATTELNDTVQIWVNTTFALHSDLYGLDWVEVFWGDGTSNKTTPDPDNDTDDNITHDYALTGIYTITVKAGDISEKVFGTDSYIIAVWNRTIIGQIIDSNGTWLGPNYPLLNTTLYGYSMATGATTASAIRGINYGQNAFEELCMEGETKYVYRAWQNDGDAYVLARGVWADRPDTLGDFPPDRETRADQYSITWGDILYDARPVYLPFDKDYAFDINGTNTERFSMILYAVPQCDVNLTNAWSDVSFSEKTCTIDYTFRYNLDYIRVYAEAFFDALLPTLINFDYNITEEEQDVMFAYSDEIIEYWDDFSGIELPLDTEDYFYLDGAFYSFNLASGRFSSLDGLVGGIYYDDEDDEVVRFNWDDSLDEPLQIYDVSEMRFGVAYDLDLEGDDIDTALYTHTARFLVTVEDSDYSNTTTIIIAPDGWSITDYSHSLLSDVTFDQENDTISYKWREVSDVDAFSPEWVEVEFSRPHPSAPSTEDEDDEDDDTDGATGEDEDEEVLPWWTWFSDNWLYLSLGAVAVAAVVVAVVLSVKKRR